LACLPPFSLGKHSRSSSFPMNTCAAPGCMEPTSQRCSSCKTAKYCSRECQRRDWIVGGHKDRCRELARQRGATDSEAALQGYDTHTAR
ncbi:unnamed protein product, partial [Ectocarpus sp. 12 AP-2014]